MLLRNIPQRSQIAAAAPVVRRSAAQVLSPAAERESLTLLAPSIQERTKAYGIEWLIKNGDYKWNDHGLRLESQPEDLGLHWSECGRSSRLASKILLQNDFGVRMLRYVIPRIDYCHLYDVYLREYVGNKYYDMERMTYHVVLLTDGNHVVDTTPWNRTVGNGSIWCPLDEHPYKEWIEASFQVEEPKRMEYPGDPIDPAVGFWPSTSDDEHKFVSLINMGGSDTFATTLKSNICPPRNATTGSYFEFMLQMQYNYYEPTKRFYYTPFGFSAELPIQPALFFEQLDTIRRLCSEQDADAMIDFIVANADRQDGVSGIFRHVDERMFPDGSEQRDGIRTLVKAFFPILFEFMARVPFISSRDIDELILFISKDSNPFHKIV
ncbi:MAG: hypothetical protein WC527_02335 [Candidatus Margulisiibacteriota bacterium]